MKSVPEQIFIQHEISYLRAIQLLREDMKFSCWIDEGVFHRTFAIC